MFSQYIAQHTRPFAALLLALSLTLALLWLVSGAISPVSALAPDPGLALTTPINSAWPLTPSVILTVTNANDSGPGTLRQAIDDSTDGDVITFDSSYAIYLSSTLNITKQLTIDGGAYTVTVSGDTGNDGTRNVQVFYIGSTGVVTLSHLNIVSGTATSGGGIYNAGTLHMSDSTVRYNAADNSGCGLYNAGAAVLSSTLIQRNYAPWPFGGGVYNIGSLQLISSTVMSNSGMAYGNILNSGGTLSLVRSIVSDGNSTSGGNAIANVNGGQALLIDSQITNNPGAIETMGSTLVITNSVIMNNETLYLGGGIKTVNSTVVITSSTLSGNSAPTGRGGGLYSESSTVELNNVTIANNTAADYSGAASGGGIYIASGTVNARNSIIAGNHDNGSGAQHPDCSGVLTSRGYNLIESVTGCTISGTLTGIITGTAPLLGNLQNNGGDTFTQALLPSSPAIDAGDDAACPPTDQRGVSRPQGAHCDIGAYEGIYSYIYFPLVLK